MIFLITQDDESIQTLKQKIKTTMHEYHKISNKILHLIFKIALAIKDIYKKKIKINYMTTKHEWSCIIKQNI